MLFLLCNAFSYGDSEIYQSVLSCNISFPSQISGFVVCHGSGKCVIMYMRSESAWTFELMC
jgi:hypothetical protein